MKKKLTMFIYFLENIDVIKVVIKEKMEYDKRKSERRFGSEHDD